MAALDQAQSDGGGDRGLADAALAHDHDQAPAVRRQKIDQPIQGGKVVGERYGVRGPVIVAAAGRDQAASARRPAPSFRKVAAGYRRAGAPGATAASSRAPACLAPPATGRRIGSSRWPGNTPLTTRCWFARPSARSSAEVRAASAIALISGRVTRMTVVAAGSQSAAIAALKRASWRLEAGVRPEARCALIIVLQKAAPGLRQAEEPKRVPGRRGVEDDVIIGPVVVGQTADELVERRDLGRAGARQLLSDLAPILIARVRPHLRQNPRAIGLGGDGGVDIEDGQRLRRRGRRPAGCPRARPSISSRLEAGSVLTSSTDLPPSASDRAVAQAIEVLPTPPLPVKNRKRVGSARNPGGWTAALSLMVSFDPASKRERAPSAIKINGTIAALNHDRNRGCSGAPPSLDVPATGPAKLNPSQTWRCQPAGR